MTTQQYAILKLPADLWDRLSEIAKEQGVNLSEPVAITREPSPPMAYHYGLPKK